MKTIIASLKVKIAVCKEDIKHDKDYIELLRSRRPEAKANGESEALEEIIEDRRELLSIRKRQLRDLRDCLCFARRANGEKPTNIDSFEPEMQSCC